MFSLKTIQNLIFLCFLGFLVSSCGTGVDAKKYPPQPELRVKKNIEEGRGFRLFENGLNRGGGAFEFASSNPLWRATLDTIDFMPLSSANYSGGIIITDWYSTASKLDERCKLNIFIKGAELKTENLSVKSYCQKLINSNWINSDSEVEKNIKIENAILNKAKKLKLSIS